MRVSGASTFFGSAYCYEFGKERIKEGSAGAEGKEEDYEVLPAILPPRTECCQGAGLEILPSFNPLGILPQVSWVHCYYSVIMHLQVSLLK